MYSFTMKKVAKSIPVSMSDFDAYTQEDYFKRGLVIAAQAVYKSKDVPKDKKGWIERLSVKPPVSKKDRARALGLSKEELLELAKEAGGK